ncbi:hypothetical protein J2S13_001851 [Oikeobacillus pervagus]|uniref:Nucleoporin-interacting protein n=1 Tax=Oikeobacillus pervagus TaxID=1325931 RepID=A0AAJ1SYZ8_9BACI|nr:hypothetical protein [Oikeobacillus pervagus]MDQ0215434.1 hypothetical protein [Oikeobacillus pervagus]
MKVKNIKWIVISVFLLIYWTCAFYLGSATVSTWDQVDFVLGVEQFDLLNMQPHFPGYPLFILGGMFLHNWIGDASHALTIFNKLLFMSTIVPVYLLSRRYVSAIPSAMIVLFTQTQPYFSTLLQQPISEGAAISILWWFIWSLHRAFQKKTMDSGIFPMILFSILMGIRLSYAPVFCGIVFYWGWYWVRTKDWKGIVFQLMILAVSNFIWISALIANVGGLQTFIRIAFGFTEGHFTEWGGTVAENDLSFLSRLWKLLLDNFLWVGVFAESKVLLGIGSILFIIACHSFWKKSGQMDVTLSSLVVILVFYFIWALFAQNIDKPRHILPLIFLAPAILFFYTNWTSKMMLTLMALYILLQGILSINLMEQQVREVPAVVQAEQYLSKEKGPLVVYTWEETRVFEFDQAPFEHKRIYTLDLFLNEVKQQPNRKIYITDHVLTGFQLQTDISIKKYVKKVKKFHSSSMFDPVYNDIILYEWVHDGGGNG